MPQKRTVQKARADAKEGKSPSTQAGEFVREEIEHVREGKHGAKNAKQAIAIGLSKARRAGVPLAPPRKGTTSQRTRRKAQQDVQKGRMPRKARPSKRRSRATTEALEREGGSSAVSKRALGRQAKQAAARRKRRTRGRAGAHP